LLILKKKNDRNYTLGQQESRLSFIQEKMEFAFNIYTMTSLWHLAFQWASNFRFEMQGCDVNVNFSAIVFKGDSLA